MFASLWSAPSGSSLLYIELFAAFIAGWGLMAALFFAPPRSRRTIIWTVTFLAGLFYVLVFFWPAPLKRDPGTLPRDFVETVGFWLADGTAVTDKFSNTLTAFLLGLGVYSILRIHIGKLTKRGTDWQFSLVLLTSMALMVFFGYWNWIMHQGPTGGQYDLVLNWKGPQYMQDLLFDGMFQPMEGAMFSLIAFYILSAAYRAFRARSIEATILLLAALVVMLSFMGAFEHQWNALVDGMGMKNFELGSVSGWLRDTFQTPSIRGMSFGIGVGALAMGLRLWLGLEKGGMNS